MQIKKNGEVYFKIDTNLDLVADTRHWKLGYLEPFSERAVTPEPVSLLPCLSSNQSSCIARSSDICRGQQCHLPGYRVNLELLRDHCAYGQYLEFRVRLGV
jgi:hypothetical protein